MTRPPLLLAIALLASALLAVAACAPATTVLPGVPAVPALPEPPAPAADAPAAAPTPPPPPGERGRDCFQHHLREAIALNRSRADGYAALTGGASRGVSRRLIRGERVALAAAREVDRRARRYQAAGIPVACAEFVSMALTPAGPPVEDPGPPPGPYRPGPDPDSVRGVLVAAYGSGGFPAVAGAAAGLLAALEDRPAYHCMTRHLLESIWRVAWLAPEHARAARRAGLPSTVPLSELLLRLNLAALPDGAALDDQAAPLQAAGVPILCRDVPPLR